MSCLTIFGALWSVLNATLKKKVVEGHLVLIYHTNQGDTIVDIIFPLHFHCSLERTLANDLFFCEQRLLVYVAQMYLWAARHCKYLIIIKNQKKKMYLNSVLGEFIIYNEVKYNGIYSITNI